MLPKLNRNMNIKVFRPTIQLKNYIDSYMIIKADEKTTKDIIP